METDVFIIGGGIVGLACAAQSAGRGFSTVLVERHNSYGQETSSRNSEVIHSGIYYPEGSLKAQLCVESNHNLYKECERTGVWFSRCGKLIVAVTEEEETELYKLYARGKENGVKELHMLDAEQVNKIEPKIKCRSALFLPGTGIVDSHQLMRSYLLRAQENKANVAFGVEYTGCDRKYEKYILRMNDTNGETVEMTAKYIINAAGLWSDKVAATFGVNIDDAGYRIHHNRGHYYSVSSAKSKLISHLVYPIPNKNLISVGIHITLDRAGQIRLGPDSEYIPVSLPETEWYKFDDSRRHDFFTAVHRYFPSLDYGDLSPAQVGVRPKLIGSENIAKDFIIREESERGLPGIVNLVGIESPGLTCAMEIARKVSSYIAD